MRANKLVAIAVVFCAALSAPGHAAGAHGSIETVAGPGIFLDAYGDGKQAPDATLIEPAGMAYAPNGDLYIADAGAPNIRKVDHATGIVSTVAGTGETGFSGDGGPATAATLSYPQDVAVASDGTIYIDDTFNDRIRSIDPITGFINTVVGGGQSPDCFEDAHSSARDACLSRPWKIALDSHDRLIVGDFGHILRVEGNGFIHSIAGSIHRPPGSTGDGGPAIDASFYYPGIVTLDPADNIYAYDINEQRIRRIDSVTGIVTTIGGNGDRGALSRFISDQTVPTESGVAAEIAAATEPREGRMATDVRLPSVWALAADHSGNVFVQGLDDRVYQINSSGVLSTYAGGGVCAIPVEPVRPTPIPGVIYGDGGAATSACLTNGEGLVFDPNGNLLVSDSFHSRIRIVYA